MRSLCTIDDLTMGKREALIGRAIEFKSILDHGKPAVPSLRYTTIANLFFEPSTRTQLSFDLAAQKFGAQVLNLNVSSSSASKGESLRDTVETVAAIGADLLIVRHGSRGVSSEIAEWTSRPVINGGEGAHAHPTQALLDAVTLVQHFGSVAGLRVGIVGDVAHSRVAMSLARLLPSLGAAVTQVGPAEFQSETIGLGAESELDNLLPELDVAYLLRVQRERGASVTGDYIERFQLDMRRFNLLPPNAVVMHPGPVNRDVEIASEVLDEKRCLVLEQVANGVPTRMAAIEWVLGT